MFGELPLPHCLQGSLVDLERLDVADAGMVDRVVAGPIEDAAWAAAGG